MRECLKCKADISARHEKAKFCSDSCRVMWNRNPKNKKEKGLTELQQMRVMYNALMEKIEQLSFPPIYAPVVEQKTTFNGFIPSEEEKPRLSLKRTPAHWVELRRDCQTADDYAKWLEDLENDTFLTAREKSQIKQTV